MFKPTRFLSRGKRLNKTLSDRYFFFTSYEKKGARTQSRTQNSEARQVELTTKRKQQGLGVPVELWYTHAHTLIHTHTHDGFEKYAKKIELEKRKIV